MFEECFSMIELNGLVDVKSSNRQEAEEDRLFHYLSHVVLSALEEALLGQDTPQQSMH